MPTQNVNISEQQSAFLHSVIESGRYCNASEVVRAGLQALALQLQEEELKLQALRKMLESGLREADEGIYANYSLSDIRERLDRNLTDPHA